MSEKATTVREPLADTLQKARELVQSDKHAEAIELLGRARKESGEGATTAQRSQMHLLTGRALIGAERGAEAVAHFRRAAELAEEAQDQSGLADAVEQLGGVFHNRHEFQQAAAHYHRAFKLYEKLGDKVGQARNLRNLGGVQIDMQNYQGARASYDQARALFREAEDLEGLASCVTNTALLLYRNPGRPAAIAEYRKALEEESCGHYLVYNNLGFLLTLDNELEEARKYLTLAREDLEKRHLEDDNYALALLNLGNVEALAQNWGPAEELLKEAARRFADIAPGRAVEVLLIPCQGHEDKGFEPFLVAEDGLKRCVSHLNLATLYSRSNRPDEALAEGQRALELDRDQPYPYLVLGWLHYQGKDLASATRCFRKAVGMEPTNEHYKQALEMVNPYLGARVGRNDPCPCGSGKKFKKCHGGEI